MKPEFDKQAATRRFDEQAGVAAELVRRFTLPIFRRLTPTTPDFEGTGLLLEVDSAHRFLVSAAHVFDNLADGIFLLAEGREQESLAGSVITTPRPPNGDRAQDGIDLGFVQLTNEEAAAVGIDNFLSTAWLSVRDAHISERGVYMVLGHAEGSQVREHRTSTYETGHTRYHSILAGPTLYKHAKLDRMSHVLIGYDRHSVIGPKGEGGSPSFKGMSGAGMWRIEATEDYRPDNLPRLAAIHLGRAPGVKELVGSRIGYLVEMLRSTYPELSDRLPRT